VTSRTMFGPAKHTYLSRIISLKTPASARESVRDLRDEFFVTSFNTKRLRIARATQLAANRALASSRNPSLSARERVEFRTIAAIYGIAAKGLFKAYKRAK